MSPLHEKHKLLVAMRLRQHWHEPCCNWFPSTKRIMLYCIWYPKLKVSAMLPLACNLVCISHTQCSILCQQTIQLSSDEISKNVFPLVIATGRGILLES